MSHMSMTSRCGSTPCATAKELPELPTHYNAANAQVSLAMSFLDVQVRSLKMLNVDPFQTRLAPTPEGAPLQVTRG